MLAQALEYRTYRLDASRRVGVEDGHIVEAGRHLFRAPDNFVNNFDEQPGRSIAALGHDKSFIEARGRVFSQWSPSSFVVNVSYFCAEQFMMAEKAHLLQDRLTEELFISSPDLRAHKRIGRGVRPFDYVIWDRVLEDALLVDTFAKFSQNPVMKQHLLSAGTKQLDEACPFNPVRGIGLRADDPEASNPGRWPGKKMRGKALSAVRDAIRISEAGKPRLFSSLLRSDFV